MVGQRAERFVAQSDLRVDAPRSAWVESGSGFGNPLFSDAQ